MSACRPDERRGQAATANSSRRRARPEPDPALGGAERDVRAAGDLVRRQAAPVGEHERLALRLGQLAERLAHRGATRRRARPAPDGPRPAALVGTTRSCSRSAARPRTWPSRHRSSARERRHQAQVGAELAALGSNAPGRRQRRRNTSCTTSWASVDVADDPERGGVHAAVCAGVCARGSASASRRSDPFADRHDNVIHAVEGSQVIRRQVGQCALMPNPDRLTGLDASFLALEKRRRAHARRLRAACSRGRRRPTTSCSPTSSAACTSSRATASGWRSRRCGVGRPVWVDDPHFNPRYHVRHTALPEPGGDDELRAARRAAVLAAARPRQAAVGDLARRGRGGRPLRADLPRPTTRSSTGSRASTSRPCSSTSSPTRAAAGARAPWSPRPEPSRAALFADALVERARRPPAVARALREALAHPDRAGAEAGRAVAGLAALAAAGVAGAPSQPAERARSARTGASPGSSVDLGAVQGDQGRARRHGQRRRADGRRGRAARAPVPPRARPRGLELKAMVPISVRADAERGALGNQVAAMYAPLPVGARRPGRALPLRARGDGGPEGVRPGGRRAGDHRARRRRRRRPCSTRPRALQARQRFFNLTVTNVPGPQFPLYMLGRRLEAFYPQVPLAANTALGIAIMSYDGHVFFGLLGDYDAMADLDAFAADLAAAIDELAPAAGVDAGQSKRRRIRARRQRDGGARPVGRRRRRRRCARSRRATGAPRACGSPDGGRGRRRADRWSPVAALARPCAGARARRAVSTPTTRRRPARTAPAPSTRDAAPLSDDQLLDGAAARQRRVLRRRRLAGGAEEDPGRVSGPVRPAARGGRAGGDPRAPAGRRRAWSRSPGGAGCASPADPARCATSPTPGSGQGQPER